MTRTAALELGRDGIRVNAILPGAIDTPMIANPDISADERAARFALARAPAGPRARSSLALGLRPSLGFASLRALRAC